MSKQPTSPATFTAVQTERTYCLDFIHDHYKTTKELHVGAPYNMGISYDVANVNTCDKELLIYRLVTNPQTSVKHVAVGTSKTPTAVQVPLDWVKKCFQILQIQEELIIAKQECTSLAKELLS